MEESISITQTPTTGREVEILARIQQNVDNALAALQTNYPNINLEEVNPASIAEFLEFLQFFMLEHLEDHTGQVTVKGQDELDIRERPGFYQIFGRKKVNIGSLKRTFVEVATEADRLSSSDNVTVSTWFAEAVRLIKEDIAGLENEAYREALPGAINRAFDELFTRLQVLTDFVMFESFRELCKYDALFDLIGGNLHRLDPVIGDLGCQWRTPFMLDLHDAVAVELVRHFDPDFIEIALNEYADYRGRLLRCPDILFALDTAERTVDTVDTGEVSKKGKRITKKMSVHKDPQVLDLRNEMDLFCDEIHLHAPTFWEFVILLEPFIALWKTDRIPGFNALEYLWLCKLFTTNRVRTLDEFGLSGIQTEIPLPGGESFLSDHLITLTNHSMAYMTYVCEDACRMQGLAINEDGYAVDEDDPDRIHIMGSALKLLKDSRVWTLQKGTFYQTNMCYGPTRAIFTRQALRRQPIIIDLRRLICTPDDTATGGYRYTYNGGDILYYAPNNQGVFEYIPGDQLTPEQRSRVGLVCEACSMVLVDGPVPGDADAVFCDQNYDVYKQALLDTTIVDLIMYGLSSHPEVTTQIHTESHRRGALDDDQTVALTNRYNREATGRDDMPDVAPGSWVLATDRIPFPDATTPEWDILLEKANLLSVLPKFEATTSQYKAPVHGDRSQADRNTQTMPFAPIHIYGSTYDIKIAELEEAEDYIENNNVNADPDLGHQRIRKDQCRERPAQ